MIEKMSKRLFGSSHSPDSKKGQLSALWTLTVMQLKEKMNVDYLCSFKKTLFHVIYFVLEFAAITAICFLLFYAAKLLNVFDAFGRIPISVLTVVFTVMLALSTVFTTIGLVQSLYLSKDNLVLLTFPATPTIVFLSKLLVYYVYELRKNFLFLIPFFFGFGLNAGYPFYYYPWAILLFIFIAALPVLLGALLSMPSLFVYQFIKKRKVLQYVLYATIFIAFMLTAYYLISLIPENINLVESWGITHLKIQSFLSNFEKTFLPMKWLSNLIAGEIPSGGRPIIFTLKTIPVLFGLLASIALLTWVCFALSKPLFYKMASTPFEYTKKTRIQERDNTKTPVFLSAIKKEWMVSMRDSSFMSLVAQLIVIMPVAIALLNSLYKAMNTRFIGTQMTVCFNFLIVLLFMLSANIRMSCAYSKDGFSAYLNKIQPSTYGALLFSKLTVNMVIGFIGILVTGIVYGYYKALDFGNLTLFMLSAYLIYVAHLFWSGEMDIMNPQYEQYATFSEQSNNPNENKSSILVFVLSFLLAIVMLLLSLENVNTAWIKVCLISAVLAGMKIFTFFLKIKVYYKEK